MNAPSRGPAGPAIVIYTRRECGLCDEAKDLVAPIAARRGLALELIDVDRDPLLAERFGLEVPVVFVHGRKAFKYRVDTGRLETLLDRPESLREGT